MKNTRLILNNLKDIERISKYQHKRISDKTGFKRAEILEQALKFIELDIKLINNLNRNSIK